VERQQWVLGIQSAALLYILLPCVGKYTSKLLSDYNVFYHKGHPKCSDGFFVLKHFAVYFFCECWLILNQIFPDPKAASCLKLLTWGNLHF
jgi:hypothetical protein